MAADFGVVYPLWDVAADEGCLLERVVGEVGVDHLTIPVVTGAQTQFRLGSGGDAPHFHTEGGWHFRARTKAYTGTTLRPPKGRWFASGDVLAEMRERATGLDVRLFVRVDVRAVRALVDQERHLCQRNAWGQEVPFAGACASNPDLRELLRATLEDLHRYEPAGCELVDWVPDCAANRSSARPLSWHADARHLLDICFCASCRQIAQRAGVDADQAARSVRVHVERVTSPGGGGQTQSEADPVIAAYVAARRADCAAWLQQLAEGGGQDCHYLLMRTLGEPPLSGSAPWVRLARLPAAGGHGAETDPVALLRASLAELSAVSLPVWHPRFGEAAELVRLVSEAVQEGVKIFDFEGLNEAAPDAVTWLKQAVRFARRG